MTTEDFIAACDRADEALANLPNAPRVNRVDLAARAGFVLLTIIGGDDETQEGTWALPHGWVRKTKSFIDPRAEGGVLVSVPPPSEMRLHLEVRTPEDPEIESRVMRAVLVSVVPQ